MTELKQNFNNENEKNKTKFHTHIRKYIQYYDKKHLLFTNNLISEINARIETMECVYNSDYVSYVIIKDLQERINIKVDTKNNDNNQYLFAQIRCEYYQYKSQNLLNDSKILGKFITYILPELFELYKNCYLIRDVEIEYKSDYGLRRYKQSKIIKTNNYYPILDFLAEIEAIEDQLIILKSSNPKNPSPDK